jgi:hypothetical protein
VGPAGLGPYNVNGKVWNVMSCMPEDIVLLNKIAEYPDHFVTMFEGFGKLSPDGASVMITCEIGSIVRDDQGMAVVVGFAMRGHPSSTIALVHGYPDGKFHGTEITDVVPLPNAPPPPVQVRKHAETMMEQRVRQWSSSRLSRAGNSIPMAAAPRAIEPQCLPEAEVAPKTAPVKKKGQPKAKAPPARKAPSKAPKPVPPSVEVHGDDGDDADDIAYTTSDVDDDVVVVSPNTKVRRRKAREYEARKEKKRSIGGIQVSEVPCAPTPMQSAPGDVQAWLMPMLVPFIDSIKALTSKVDSLEAHAALPRSEAPLAAPPPPSAHAPVPRGDSNEENKKQKTSDGQIVTNVYNSYNYYAEPK